MAHLPPTQQHSRPSVRPMVCEDHGVCVCIQVLTGAITSGATGYQFYNSVIVRKGADSDVNWVRCSRRFW